MNNIIKIAGALGLAFATNINFVYASCGASFCSVNTFSEVEDVTNQGGIRLGLRYEFIDQDQPRHGRKRVAVGQIRQHHDEIRTINRNVILGLDYAARSWGIAADLPFFNRSHQHIHHHHGAVLYEDWSIKEAGDLRLLGRYQYRSEVDASAGINFGAKLPTGDFTQRNGQGALAERSLQAGSGTSDIIVGGYYNRYGERVDWFMQTLLQAAIKERAEYRPGNKLSFDVGLSHALGNKTKATLQVNTLMKGRDRGSEAEPANTGGSFISMSPGLAYKATPTTQLYGFVQLPIYQRVNGVQPTFDWALALGWKMQF